jgi:hypothetical protein
MQVSITRPDGSEIKPLVITTGRQGHKTTHTVLTEPLVDPAGQVIDALVNTRLEHPGLVFVRMVEGQLVLTKHARDNGLVSYRDMCLGKIEGVEASAIHWRIYQKLTEMAANGQRPATDAITPEQMWHPEVVRRMAAEQAGGHRVDADAMAKILDDIRAQGTDDEAAEARAVKAGIDFEPSDDKPIGELLAEASKKRGSRA